MGFNSGFKGLISGFFFYDVLKLGISAEIVAAGGNLHACSQSRIENPSLNAHVDCSPCSSYDLELFLLRMSV